MKKKTITAVIALAAVLAFAGCGKGASQTSSSSSEPVMDGPMGPVTYTSVEDEPVEDGGDVTTVADGEETTADATDTYTAYLSGLGSYLTSELDLEKYDEEIENIGLYELNDAYGNDIGLKYIRLANNINTDILPEEAIEILQSGDEYAIKNIIESTYKEAIMPNGATEDDETYYGNSVLGSSGPNMVPASAVVLQIETQERYLDTGNLEDPDGVEERKEEIEGIVVKMQEEIGDKLDVPVYVQALMPL